MPSRPERRTGGSAGSVSATAGTEEDTATAAAYTTAQEYRCPAGHAGPHGEPLRMVVPGGLGLAPACTVCRQPMTPAGGPLDGRWRADECCVPAGPDGRWYGPPRDPGVCTSCFGTRRHALCLACFTVNCAGSHGDTCLACDGTGRGDCESCDGEGHVYNQFGEDEGLCPDPRCVAGRVPCAACQRALTRPQPEAARSLRCLLQQPQGLDFSHSAGGRSGVRFWRRPPVGGAGGRPPRTTQYSLAYSAARVRTSSTYQLAWL